MICEACEQRRSNEANAAQWPILQAWAAQKEWPINGVMSRLSPDEWKDVLTCAFEGETRPRIAPSLDGARMVMLGRRTSRYGKKRFGEWLDWLNAASHHAGIKVPAPKYMEAA